MKATKYWPNESFWESKILFFETSEEKPSPRQVGYMLRNYGMQGIFSRVNGMIFGRAKDYTEAEKAELNQIILDLAQKEFRASQLPIVVDFDFGHTDPKLLLPLGGKARLDGIANEIILLDSPFC
ncbi:hypothetical protein [Paenibacillus sp. HB172176]|uniref:hypothetical protein n=1 Tax=Paenibacillus sp. HB172176 TaxID=2493690 RepID=UPI001F115FA2|nr:hypothetical protein [Paenibacillus sp. HB172176]